jgi:uncharacterized protein (TIGR02996 family)
MSEVPADLQGLHAALDADPADQRLRLVLADWYEEHGAPQTAEALRWLAGQGKHPARYWEEWVWHNPASAQQTWYHGRRQEARHPTAAEVLPQELWQALECPTWRSPAFWKPYATRRAAEEEACRALYRARAEGWQPEA